MNDEMKYEAAMAQLEGIVEAELSKIQAEGE